MADWTLLRPYWGLIWCVPLVLQLWHWHRQHSGQSFINSRLLGYLRQQGEQQASRPLRWLWLPWTLLILALMGPAHRQPSPLYQRDDIWIWMLDVSRSMQADDLPPNRLLQARYRLMELLALADGRRIALIAYAGDAYLITPPTDDVQTLSHMLRELEPDVMPVAGSAPERAVQLALALQARNAQARTELLLITDDMTAPQANRISQLLRPTGQPLDIMAVGTPQGAAIPLTGGGLLRDRHGQVVIARTPLTQLAQLAADNQGRIIDTQADVSLLQHFAAQAQGSAHRLDLHNQQWQDLGFWLLPTLLPLAWLFRRGWLFVCLLLPAVWHPHSAMADNLAASQAYRQGDYVSAARQFDDARWRGHALYRSGDFAGAILAYRDAQPDAETCYNLGNAYAQQLAFEEAIAAYDQALQLEPSLQDARLNRELVLAWLAQQTTTQPARKRPTPTPAVPDDVSLLPNQAADPGNLMRNRLQLQQQRRQTREGAQPW